MRRFSDKHSMHTLNELNVTPLLDLAFVLLLIFMITTPLMENSTELILPSGRKDSASVDPNSVLNISIYRDDRLLLNTDAITLQELSPKLAALHAAKPDVAVLVRSHKELPIQRLMEVLDAVKAAQITKVGLAKISEGQ
jgi:biopolymer transport protein ExbD